jgi:hypothetical protein
MRERWPTSSLHFSLRCGSSEEAVRGWEIKIYYEKDCVLSWLHIVKLCLVYVQENAWCSSMDLIFTAAAKCRQGLSFGWKSSGWCKSRGHPTDLQRRWTSQGDYVTLVNSQHLRPKKKRTKARQDQQHSQVKLCRNRIAVNQRPWLSVAG